MSKEDKLHAFNDILGRWSQEEHAAFWDESGHAILDYDLLLRMLSVPVSDGARYSRDALPGLLTFGLHVSLNVLVLQKSRFGLVRLSQEL